MADELLAQARALRAAHPDTEALRALPIADLPPPGPGCPPAVRMALTYLRDEMLLVRAGAAGGLTVLDDEIAHAEMALDVAGVCRCRAHAHTH